MTPGESIDGRDPNVARLQAEVERLRQELQDARGPRHRVMPLTEEQPADFWARAWLDNCARKGY